MNILVKRALKQMGGDKEVLDAINNIVASLGIGPFDTESEEDKNGDSLNVQEKDFVDCRIKTIRFSDFRLFPKQYNGDYGLSFQNDKKPSSCVFIGANGTGKSSIFSAMEYAYTGYSSHREEVYGIDTYLNYAFEDKGTSSLSLYMSSGDCKKIGIPNNTVMDYPRSFFCSEHDINIISKEQNLARFVLEQTGYADLWKLKSELENKISKLSNVNIQGSKLSGKRKREVLIELKKMSDAKIEELNRFSDLESIDEVELKKEHLLFKARWDILKSPVTINSKNLNPQATSTTTEIDKSAVAKLLEMYKTLSKVMNEEMLDELRELVASMDTINDSDENEEIAKEISTLKTAQTILMEIIGSLFKEICADFSKFIEEELVYFSPSKNEDIFTFFTKDNNYISLSIKADGHKDPFTTDAPSYLNTFRFRIYCILLKVSLSIWYMKKSKTILPIVIDDIFSSSDFDNNNRLDIFIYEICELYNRQIKEKCKCNIPLQLIILTHDNQAKYALEKGLNTAKIHKMLTSDVISKRIFSPIDIKGHEREFRKADFINLYI